MTQKEKARRFDMLVNHLRSTFDYGLRRHTEESKRREVSVVVEYYGQVCHENFTALRMAGAEDGRVCPCNYCASKIQKD